MINKIVATNNSEPYFKTRFIINVSIILIPSAIRICNSNWSMFTLPNSLMMNFDAANAVNDSVVKITSSHVVMDNKIFFL